MNDVLFDGLRFAPPILRILPVIILFALTAINASAQTYPQRPVRFIVPVAPGGATDILTRTIAQRLTTAWGQQVIVDNRAGAGSNVGFEAAAQAPPDGHTLLMAQPAFTVNVSLYKKLAYDPLRDFAPVTLTANSANAMVVHPSIPTRTLKEFIALAKAKPGQLNYASSGNGSSGHLSGELIKTIAGIDITHIPYKGASTSLNDLMGGHVDMAIVSLSSVLPMLTAKRLRALVVTSAKRSVLMPELPTFAEAGLPGIEISGWYGVMTRAGVMPELVERLHADITRVLAQSDVVRALAAAGLEVVPPNTPDQFAAHLRAEIAKWAKVVKASGARAD